MRAGKAKRRRIDPHRGGIGRPTTRTVVAVAGTVSYSAPILQTVSGWQTRSAVIVAATVSNLVAEKSGYNYKKSDCLKNCLKN